MANQSFDVIHNTSSMLISPMGVQLGLTTQHPGYSSDVSLGVPLAVFYSIFFLLGLSGNLLALWVFLRLHSKKNSVRVFLINLAVADLLLMICLPFRIAYHVNGDRWVLGPVFCSVVGNVFYMNMYISIAMLGLISVDRYLKLQRRRAFIRRKHGQLACILLWVISLAGVLPMIHFFGKNQKPNQCFHYKRLTNFTWKAYINFALVFLFWMVYGALMMSYGKIATGLLKTSREKPDLPNARKYTRTARKSFFVLFLFTVCFVPYHTVRIFYILSQISHVSERWTSALSKANEISLLLSAFNSCLDPVMYFVLCGSVRRAVLQVLCKKNFCPGASGSSSSSSNETGRNQPEQLMESETLRRKAAIQNSTNNI